jgi:threonine dehydratase
MMGAMRPPLVRLHGLFPNQEVYARCEFLAPGGSFKIRGANHLFDFLRRQGGPYQLVVPSMGNTALGVAVGAKAAGFLMTGVVPRSISRAKDEKLTSLGVELIKIDGGGDDLLRSAMQIASERGAYFVHPHLDPNWTDGYQSMAAEILDAVPGCRTLVVPIGGGGLLLGLLAFLRQRGLSVRLVGCEPYNFPTYAPFTHKRVPTIADGLLLESPHPRVAAAIAEQVIDVMLAREEEIRQALRGLYERQGLVVEPSSAITLACVRNASPALEEPICAILTGENITRQEHGRLIEEAAPW